MPWRVLQSKAQTILASASLLHRKLSCPADGISDAGKKLLTRKQNELQNQRGSSGSDAHRAHFRDLGGNQWRCSRFHRPAEAVVFKAAPEHCSRIEQVPAVYHQWTGHQAVDTLPIQLAKLFPLGQDQQSIGVLRYFVRFPAAVNLR